MIKQARLDAGLHIAALAVTLRVPVKRIEALENEQFDLLPDMVFVRALTSSICQVLKIDAAPFLEKLPKVTQPRLDSDEIAINTPIGAAAGVGKVLALSDVLTSPWLMGVALLCIAAAGIYVWPKAGVGVDTEITTSSNGLLGSGSSQAKVQTVTEETTAISNPNVLNAQVASSSALVTTSVNSAVSASGIVSVSGSASTNTPVSNTPAALPPADSIVVFKASAETWVEVRNANGSTAFKKLLKAGEVASAKGLVPLTVIVGKADATQIEVRGKPVDLALIAKNNVARFEVN